MNAPLVVAVAPGSPADLAGLRPGDAVTRVNGRVPRDVIEWRLWSDEAGRRPGDRPQRHRPRAGHRQAGRRAARRRGLQRPVRPGPHVRQPLRVLLHLPAPEGPAPQPLPEGRRLPAELPVRELHDADPVHRGRSGAGRDRGPVAAARQHPLDRPGPAGPDAAQPAWGDEPALAAGAARPRHRGPWPARDLPGRERRARRSTTRWPGSSTSTRSWRRSRSCRSASPASTPRPRCGAHTVAEAAAVVDAVEDWQDVYARRARAAASSTPPTSTTCWPAGRSPPPGRTRGSPMHEDGIGMARTFELEFTGAADDTTGVRRGFFAAVDAPASSCARHARRDLALPPNPAAYTGLRAAPADVRRRPAATPVGTDRDPVRRARRAQSSAHSSPASVATTCASSRSATSSSAATPASPA